MCWHWVKCVSGQWGQLKRGFEVLALCETCFRTWGQWKGELGVLALGEICFEGMGAVEKAV